MKNTKWLSICIAGAAAGTVNGLFGAGGGMVLVPLLTLMGVSEEVFPASVFIILPVCVVSLLLRNDPIPWTDAFPYLIGSAFGGIAAGLWGQKIPNLWLHRILGILILYGGIRYLC